MDIYILKQHIIYHLLLLIKNEWTGILNYYFIFQYIKDSNRY